MQSGSRKKGVVVDQEGRPVGGASVAVISGTAPVPEIAIRADRDGAFLLWVPVGSFTVEAHAPDGASGTIEVSETSVEPIVLRLRQARP
jgi:hypothetical protein